MQLLRSFQVNRMLGRYRKDLIFASIAAVSVYVAVSSSLAAADKLISSLLFGALLFAAVLFRKNLKAAYAFASLALIMLAAGVRPETVQNLLVISFSLSLLFCFMLPHPFYTMGAVVIFFISIMLFQARSGSYGEWLQALVFLGVHVSACALFASNMSKLKKERNEYREMSRIDSMTGLASLQHTLQFGQRLLDMGKRVRILLIDLNFFKQINDSYGHMIGNKVIMHYADYLRNLVERKKGLAGRLGGDEFVVVLEDQPGYAQIHEKILEDLNGKTVVFDRKYPPITLSFSVGHAVSVPGKTFHIEELMHDADLNMYDFKLRNRVPLLSGKNGELIEHNPDMICTFDRKGKLVAVNPAAAKLLGYDADLLVSNRMLSSLIERNDRSKIISAFREALAGNPNQFEMTVFHREGRRIPVSVTIIPIIADREIAGIYTVAKDLSEKKKAEELLRNSDRLAVLGQLAAGLAHEIRNPLTALKGFIQLLHSSNSDNKAYYPIMLNELDRINLILNEFLLLSKPHSANFSKADIRVVLEHVVTLIETQAIMNKVRIENTADDDIPLLLCDENQMKQVFVNVLKNAIEAMPDGGKVTVSTTRAGDYVRIRVKDEGEGIPDHLLESIGEPFFTTKENGTGLGLMICHKIMENHGGKLTISSRQGEGTVVDIDLPCEGKNAGLYAT